MPILMLIAADRLDDKPSGFELGADDYLTRPFELQALVLRLRALDRRRAHNRPPVRESAGLLAGQVVAPVDPDPGRAIRVGAAEEIASLGVAHLARQARALSAAWSSRPSGRRRGARPTRSAQ
jgi:DNA-binding response OmpR family regulator